MGVASEMHKYLRAKRIRRGETLKDMADKLGLTSAELSAFEHGERKMSKEFLDHIESLYEDDAYKKVLEEISHYPKVREISTLANRYNEIIVKAENALTAHTKE